MTDFPQLKFKALVNFPAQVSGRVGIDVDIINGAYFIDLDYSGFPVVENLPMQDVPNLNVLLWNSVTNSFLLCPIILLGTVTSGGSNQIITTDVPVVVANNDGLIVIDQPVPTPTAVSLPLGGNKVGPVHITDAGMNASGGNITITPTSPETINGLPSWTIAGDGGAVTLYPLSGVGYVL